MSEFPGRQGVESYSVDPQPRPGELGPGSRFRRGVIAAGLGFHGGLAFYDYLTLEHPVDSVSSYVVGLVLGTGAAVSGYEAIKGMPVESLFED